MAGPESIVSALITRVPRMVYFVLVGGASTASNFTCLIVFPSQNVEYCLHVAHITAQSQVPSLHAPLGKR